MNYKIKTAAIVDPYSSGSLIAARLKEYGYRCLHIQSSPSIPSVYAASLRAEDFFMTIIHQGSLDQTLKQVQKINPEFILIGNESGVTLFDALTEKLGLFSNGTKLSTARRDKFWMNETVRMAGNRAVKQIAADSADAILAWIASHHHYPVVLKPLNSAGTDSVFLCRNEVEVKNRFAELIGKKNKLDLINTQVLAQEYLTGTEYVVDCINCRGKRVVTGIWRYSKIKAQTGAFIYESLELLPFEGSDQEKLVAYNDKVLDSLDINFGPSHSEIMMTEAGPILVEVGARYHGGNNPVLTKAATGRCPIDLTIQSLLCPEDFLRQTSRSYGILSFCKVAFFISSKKGIISNLRQLDRINELSSSHTLTMKCAAGDFLSITTDIFSIPGWVVLLNPNRQVLADDYRRVRDIEATGLFDLNQEAA